MDRCNGGNVCAIRHRPYGCASVGLAITLPIGATAFMNFPLASSDLRILATSDVHMHLTGWNAMQDAVTPGRGMDALACRIDAARHDAPGICILVDNGDALQGTPVGTTCAAWTKGAAHPWPAILNALDYDVLGLGNHDFDFGLPFLEQIVAQTQAPMLCASFAKGGVKGVAPTTLLTRSVTCSDGVVRTVKIGVTSVLPPQTLLWNHSHLSGRVRFHPGVTAAKKAVQALRDAGAEVVVMLCHSGLPACCADDSEDFAAKLAKDVDGIDALVMGHTHRLFPTTDGPTDVHGVAAVMPGYGAEALGVIDLRLGWDGHHWRVIEQSSALHVIHRSEAPRPDLTDIAAPAIAATQTSLDVELGRTETGFHSYFSMLQSDVSCALIGRAMTREIAKHVADTDLSDLPLIASVSPAALGGHAGPANFVEVAPGVVRARHMAVLAPYTNTIWAAVMKGADLYRWAERSAAYFAPRQDAKMRLVNPNMPSFNFDILQGLEAVIDPFRPAMFTPAGQLIDANARRVQSLTYKSQPVAPTQKFLLAMTSFRGAGGGAFPGLRGEPHVMRTDIDLLTALRKDVADGPLLPTSTPTTWRFTEAIGQRVVIETSPNARAHLHDIAHFDPKEIGVNAAGFLELSVAL